jgi:hypothetical protein
MKLAFIMPSPMQRQKIGALRESVVELRPDQLRHFEHLLRSWGIFGRPDAIEVTWRAVKRTLRDRP